MLCAWGSNGTEIGTPGWVPGFGNFVYSSTDYGATWEAAAPIVGEFFNECQVAALPDHRVVMISRRQVSVEGRHSYAIVTFSPDLKSRTEVRTLEGIDTPICEGSLVATDSGDLYFANPSSQTDRANLTIHKSSDAGLTWPTKRLIWPSHLGPSGYSGMTATAEGLVLIFEGGDGNLLLRGGNWGDVWVKTTVVPYF